MRGAKGGGIRTIGIDTSGDARGEIIGALLSTLGRE
jgi:hypothetical protein